MSQQQQKSMNDTLFDTKVLDNFEQEFQQVHDDINPKVHSRIAPLVYAIKGLKQEINQVFADFIRETNRATDVMRIKDMFEAVLMEYNLREKESNKLMEAILQNDSQQIRQISQLLKEIRELQLEVNHFQRQSEVKRQRQCGIFKGNPTDFKKQNTSIIDETSIYDWVVDIDFITSINSSGWKVWLSPKMINQEIINIKALEGATVAVTGLYDKGKTFVLNSLTMSNLPSGKKVTTRGISFKHVNVDNGTKLILVDTAGTYSPVKIENELSIVDKEATETFISDLVFDLADYFLCVVNDFTSLDQRYLDRLSRNLQQSPNKTFREIIVIHNLKDVESTEILEHVWSTQVTQIYANGTLQKTKVAALNPINKQLLEKHVLWFKTPYTRHVCIVNDDCNLGKGLNPWVFSLLRYWLKAVFIPVNRSFSVLDCLLIQSRQKLVNFFRKNIKIDLKNTDDPLIKVIKTENEFQDKIQIPQGQVDMSGLITGQQDSFQPATDIIAGDQYIILMDAPGLTNDDVDIQRQNVVTLVKGNKQRPYINQGQLEKSERKYGEFTLTFKIPDIYERQWSHFGVEKGVITIKYDKDKDDI
ncbi:unnamed protein product (macronuclear) [Paramecium tetraurelia]|uniref:SHSP domain-containing protein n=1 Tax=Paramecium tetraurelia TaxID=5888 RepID=A0CIM5_PARTE|nr:uncharacterized protein GSPATT00007777001 [Paramecium tetraurelia]CAK70642.1 unnamed protein product [Paramecium tetraurelia]|eukprot:XP_001438039.1 hypothetical protein (macronuclear) [Paramecium tetraurelia strain d4-2]